MANVRSDASFWRRVLAALTNGPRVPAPEPVIIDAPAFVPASAAPSVPWIEPVLPSWFWTLPSSTLLAVLDADGARFAASDSLHEFHWSQLRELALHLVVATPAGPPFSTADFLSRFDPVQLAKLWGGVFDADVPWAGVSGVDRMIAAVIGGRHSMLPCLHAEILNQLRHWAEFPEQLRTAVLTVEPAADPYFSNSDKEI
ncbi:hypothetical protein DFR70_13335 [Nocardia tenerifensis]|uniref:Uncharacterized protein n=1 Tax=Nocardia tenerifensis TaxID=228006 RepID=A0A318JRT8_9NOCA|nr:hypothetical protein [Nocardia tenerifensis]PXX52303.1 hypothetical protein DFR70_13335 [Nocardia tenerifensis]